MDELLTMATLALCATIFVRMFTYRREGARFRRGVSIMATVVMGCCGAMIIYILAGDIHVSARAWPMVGLLAVLAVALVRCNGNLSSVLRDPSAWDGRERRGSRQRAECKADGQ